jgi:hypothetical protein
LGSFCKNFRSITNNLAIFSKVNAVYILIITKMDCVTFWTIFLQTPLVTLMQTYKRRGRRLPVMLWLSLISVIIYSHLPKIPLVSQNFKTFLTFQPIVLLQKFWLELSTRFPISIGLSKWVSATKQKLRLSFVHMYAHNHM